MLPPARIDVAVPSLLVVAVHGRDQSAGYLLEHLVDRVHRPDVCWVLPRAEGRRWYEGRASDPLSVNERELTGALAVVRAAAEGWPVERTVLAGFSQGGCVVAELLARHPASCAGAALLTGTLLGPDPGHRSVCGRLDGLPVVLGVGSDDPWMPVAAAEATRAVLAGAGAETELRVTDSGEHAIHDADVELVASLIDRLLSRPRR